MGSGDHRAFVALDPFDFPVHRLSPHRHGDDEYVSITRIIEESRPPHTGAILDQPNTADLITLCAVLGAAYPRRRRHCLTFNVLMTGA